MTRLIVLSAILLQCANAQLVGPTVTPTTTDNNEIGSAATPTTTDLTGLSSSNFNVNSASSTPQSIIIISGCGTSCGKTSTGIQIPTASESAQNQSNDISADNHNKNTIIIACSVSAGVLLILISFLICFFYRRKRQREGSFINNKSSSNFIESLKNTKEDENVKTYNISPMKTYRTSNDNDSDDDNKITPPVVLYTDVMKQSKQQNGKGSARLSKYNFLAQMFTQMKESYSLGAMVLAQDSVTRDDRIQSQHNRQSPIPERLNNNGSPSLQQNHNLKESLGRNSDQESQLNSYQMNHPYPINQDRSTTSMASTPLPESGRESTTTVDTLHAPLFKNNGLYPPRAHTKPKPSSPILNKQPNESSNSDSRHDILSQHSKSTTTRTVENKGTSRPYDFF